MKLGEKNSLTILRNTSVGMYLGDSDGNDVLLPQKYLTDAMQVGRKVEVFLYKDSEDRIVATTEEPYLKLHEFAYLGVKSVGKMGAFMDWGLEKDLLVPFKEQPNRLKEGDWATVFLLKDERTDRLIGSCKVNKFLEEQVIDLELNQEVTVLLYERTDLGYNVIINNRYRGLIYHNEIFQKVYIGMQTTGFVKKLRDDSRIDISLTKPGQPFEDSIEPNSARILALLDEEGGFLPLSDSTDPNTIYNWLGMSKKTFKKTIGNLYRERKIRIADEGIYKS
ncbi:MAG: S1-like domain-containing RNA-binding protein [Spirosomataceae bacterium]